MLKVYDAKTGARQHESRLGDGRPVMQKIYWTGEDEDVYVVRTGRTFDLLAHTRMGESCLATPAVSRGTLFFRTRHYLVAIAAAT